MKYKVGQQLRFIGKILSGHEKVAVYTKGKIYTISGFSDEYRSLKGAEYYMVRDDGFTGMWWEKEIDKSFITLKEERKKKLKKINIIKNNNL